MLAAKRTLILHEVEEGTGAEIDLEVDSSGVQSGLRLRFADLPRSSGPVVTLRPTGLRRFEARLSFGNFAAATIAQMKRAEAEETQLARALVASVARSADVSISGNQSLDDWMITDGTFTITAEKRDIGERFDDETLAATCRELVIPMLAAMAELYGYEAVAEPGDPSGEVEGAVSLSVVKRRERNPRNRLLCLRIHGSRCKICSLDPKARYLEAGMIIEVHHLQPLSHLGEPRSYDPETDLMPLCPNCHRAIHTRRPLPWTPEELLERLRLDC